MRLRYLPPVYSPLSFPAVLAGLFRTGRLEEVRAHIERDYAPAGVLLADSGTSALRLALEAAAAERGERSPVIAMPAYCCFDVATAADGAGAGVVLYDLDPATLSPDRDSLQRALALRPAVIVVAHLYGLAADLDLVAAVARETGAVIVEDAAQGVGGASRGRPLGASGTLGVLSFGRGKGRTGGHGGALLANDSRGAELLEPARNRLAPAQGAWTDRPGLLAQWALARPAWYRIPASLPFLQLGETIYRPAWPPRDMDKGSAGTLAATWKASHSEADARRRNAARLDEILSGRTGVEVIRPLPDTLAGFLRFPVLLPAGSVDAAARALGVMPGYPHALSDLRGFGARCLPVEDRFEGARDLARRLITFPTHSRLRAADLRAIEQWVSARFPRG